MPHKLTFFDIETTGLDPIKNEILELAAVEVDIDTLEVTRSFVAKTKPVRMETAHPKALEVCGYRPDDWREAIDLKQALRDVYPLLVDCIPGGHNVSFDIRFLKQAYHQHGLPSPRFHSLHVDTQTIVGELRAEGVYPAKRSLSLDSVAGHFSIQRPSPHRAYDDVMACVEVIRKIKTMRRSEHADL